MPYEVSMMGCVGSGEDFCGLGWVQKFWAGLGFEKVTHDQLWRVLVRDELFRRCAMCVRCSFCAYDRDDEHIFLAPISQCCTYVYIYIHTDLFCCSEGKTPGEPVPYKEKRLPRYFFRKL